MRGATVNELEWPEACTCGDDGVARVAGGDCPKCGRWVPTVVDTSDEEGS